jgi:alanyl-tRNA synthetase
LRFDFSHFSKVTDEELTQIEQIVNDKIKAQIALNEQRMVPIQKAVDELGATALFGEKYGDVVRVITFDSDYSIELCGGTHIDNTSKIKHFKIVSESSVAAGVRRIEAITGSELDRHYKLVEATLQQINEALGQPKDLLQSIQKLQEEKTELNKKIEQFELAKAAQIKTDLIQAIVDGKQSKVLIQVIEGISLDHIKTIAFQLKSEQAPLLGVIGATIDNKPNLIVFASDALINEHQINCSTIVRDLAKHIQGGGGGQAFYANAGGKLLEGIAPALEQAKQLFL